MEKFRLLSGALVAVLSVPVMIFGPQPTPDCALALTDTQLKCDAKVTDVQQFTWTVTKSGSYEVTVYAMNSTSKSTPFNPGVIITDKTGSVVGKAAGGIGNDAVASVQVEPGTYIVKVFPADHFKAKGGYRYRLSILNPTVNAPGSSVATR